MVICPECEQSFGTTRGLLTHRSTHAETANTARLNEEQRIDADDADEEEGEDEDIGYDLKAECDRWYSEFAKIAANLQAFDASRFNASFGEFAKFLFTANQELPGPQHPACRFYQMRQRGKDRVSTAQYARSSNPQRTDARRRQRNQEQYEYELAQYDYVNRRPRVVRKVTTTTSDKEQRCHIPIDQLEDHYRSVFSVPNARTLEEYLHQVPKVDVAVSMNDIKSALKGIKMESSPGLDGVLVRTLRLLPVIGIFKKITDILLATGAVPPELSIARLVLRPKGGENSDISNWRPIAIFSVIRRVIERALDKHLRRQLDLNPNQRGFVNGVPGCHVNASLVRACLLKAKTTQTNLTVVFLDMTKAYDNIGHDHVERSLATHGVSTNMKRLIMALLKNNSIKIDLGIKKSQEIDIKRSVPQGGPLSPMLFNMAIDHVFKEVCDPVFAGQYGYKLYDDLDPLSLIGFADDLAVISSSPEGACRITELIQTLLHQIGLKINPIKSEAINIKDGMMVPGHLQLADGSSINCIGRNQKVRYLGCTFTDELVFDSTVVGKITEKLNCLIKTRLLKRDQKINIMNQYILPMLTYPLQAAPLRKIPRRDLQVLDLNIRNSVKAIIGLPLRTSTEMFYAPRKFRGLGLVRCEWEVYLQHFSIALRLSKVSDVMFQRSYNCAEEMRSCKEALAVEGDTTQKLRSSLRNLAYEKWSGQMYQGIGVKHFKTYPKANQFLSTRKNLSSSEWVAALKLNINYANLAGVPGVNTEHRSAPSIRCRRCAGNETETIPHVLGACDFGDNRRTERHHVVKRKLQALLQAKGFTCFDEATCTDDKGSCRRIDILAFAPGSDRAYIIDPTIRYETNEDLDVVVQEEKERTYRGCIQDLQRRYQQFGKREYEVIGLWWGSRGTISSGVIHFFDRFKLDKKLLPEMAENVLISSIRMLHHHIYSA